MTESALSHPVVADYLDELERAAQSLPRRERRELLAEIRVHIEERMEADADSEAAVQRVIDELGPPQAIVAAAGSGRAPLHRGWQEITAVVLLLIGGLLLPVFGWIIGVVLLWSSKIWETWEKVLGTVIFPGGLGLPLISIVISFRAGAVVSWVGVIMLMSFMLVQLFVAAYLIRAARRMPVDPWSAAAGGTR